MKPGYYLVGAAALALGAAFVAPATAQSGRETAESRLNTLVERAIHGDGPLLLDSERALIERKCGYALGSWDGRSINMSNGVLHCTNGRRVDDAETRAMMEVAGERISRRVNAAMSSPEVRDAISGVAREATEEALRDLRLDGRRSGRRR